MAKSPAPASPKTRLARRAWACIATAPRCRSAEEQEEIDLALAMAASMATHEQESRAPPRVSADSAAEADEEEQLRRALELSKLEDTTRRPLLASSPRLLPRLLARATRSPCSQLLLAMST